MLSACFFKSLSFKTEPEDFIVRAFFPLSAKAYDLKSLLVIALVYIAVSVATGFVLGLIGWIPLIGRLLGIVSQLVDLYCLAGIVVAVMIYFKI